MGRLIKAALGAGDGRGLAVERVAEAERIAADMVAEAEAEGLEQGRLEASELVRRIEALEEELRNQSDRNIQAAARELVESVLRERVASHEGFLAMVRHSLRAMRRGREIFLRVHPDRAEHLQKHRQSLVAVLGRARTIEIREDISLPRDGCVVETDAGLLDVGLGTQLGALFEGVDR